jgi:hypothetical protein
MVAMLAAALVIVIVEVTGAELEQLTTTLLGTVVFSVLATLSSVLTAFGAQFKGLVPAILALIVMLAFASLAGGAILLLSALACVAGLSLLIHQFSDARVFS